MKKTYQKKLLQKYLVDHIHTQEDLTSFQAMRLKFYLKVKIVICMIKKNKFIDYGMGLRSSILGYSNNFVNNAIKEIQNGNNLSSNPNRI